MGGLVLKLRAGERVLVNGAALESCGRPSRLRVITPGTDILRMRDAIDPEAARTPVGQLAHVVQMLVAGAVDPAAAAQEARVRVDDLRAAFVEPGDLTVLDRVAELLDEGRAYPALRLLRDLRDREARIFAMTGGM